jgi:hypothetical protein
MIEIVIKLQNIDYGFLILVPQLVPIAEFLLNIDVH